MRTVAFEFGGDTKYLYLPKDSYSDEELAGEAVKAIYWQVFLKHQREGSNKTPEECMAEAETIPWQMVDATTLPEDRYFRAALRVADGKFYVDMVHARKIHMDRIREARNKRLATLDVETMKAVGKEDDMAKAAVEAVKQALRDIPQTLDLTVAKTPEELKNVWAKELL